MSTILNELADSWRPDELRRTERIGVRSAQSFAALLGVPAPANAILPPMWHWFTFTPTEARRKLGSDGHPRDGHFLPPVPHRRRMMAGGRLFVNRPMMIGSTYERVSTAADITVRSGRRSGEMLFVTVRHEFWDEVGCVAVEEEDVVYRQQPTGATGASARNRTAEVAHERRADGFELSIPTDSITLFRFSALTYNAHRIHYDAPYATEVEGYDGLVVHGPLLALALLELPRRNAPERVVERFSYRLTSPLMCDDPIVVTAAPQDRRWLLQAGAHASGWVNLSH